MDQSSQTFAIGNKFQSNKELEDKLEAYKQNEKYSFTCANSKTFKSVKNLADGYNEALIYDERYFRCSVNPKPDTLKKFKKEHPEIVIILCPALLVVRATKDKQFLKVTKFVPNHDHDPSAPQRLQKYKLQIEENFTQEPEKISCQSHTDVSTSSKASTDLEQTVETSDQHLLDVQDMNPSLQTNTLPVVDNIVNSPVTLEKDDYDELLLKLKINITSTTDDAEKKNKLSEMNKMLTSFNIEFGAQSMNNALSPLNSGSLTIYLSRSRGRGRGRRDRVIGLSKRTISTTSKAFINWKNATKIIMVLSMVIPERSEINKIILGKVKITKNHLKDLQSTNVCDALASESITGELIKEYFETDAFIMYQNIIEDKIKSDTWTCKMCNGNLNTDNSVECDKCLYWSHWKCVEVTEEPLVEWFCPICLA